jgi:hypothetical protein
VTTESRSLLTRFDARVAEEFARQPLTAPVVLTDADLAHLPPPVQRFVTRSGAVGRPRVQNVRVAFDAQMWRKPGAAPMRARSVQYNFYARPARIFLMDARMLGLPVRALHVYSQEQATFTVRLASLVTMVDHSGEGISRTETVTVLNDMCFFNPGGLVDPRLTWEPGGDTSCIVTFANGPHRVAATLTFNERDELVDFRSDDRPASQGDGTFVAAPWSTPIEGYRDLDGRHLPTRGSAVYSYPDGDFTYGRFEISSIAYDCAGP